MKAFASQQMQNQLMDNVAFRTVFFYFINYKWHNTQSCAEIFLSHSVLAYYVCTFTGCSFSEWLIFSSIPFHQTWLTHKYSNLHNLLWHPCLKSPLQKAKFLVLKGDLHCQCILSIFPAGVHQFYTNTLALVNINLFLYIKDQIK